MGTRHGYLRTLAICALLGACSSDSASPRPSSVDRSQAALGVAISAPFHVERYPTLTDIGIVGVGVLPAIGCGDTTCLAIFSSIANRPAILGRRIGPNGDLLDLPPLVLSEADVALQTAVLPQAAGFLAIWSEESSAEKTGAVRLSAATGQVVEDVSSKMPAGRVVAAYAAGTTVLLITSNATATRAVFLKASDLTPVGTALDLPRGVPDVVVGEGQYLFTWSGFEQRFDGTTGAPLDASPVEFSHYLHGTVAGVSMNGVYQLAFVDGAATYGARIRASDGAVLDPDDTFNQIPGPQAVCENCAGPGARARVTRVGPNPLVAWQGPQPTPEQGGGYPHVLGARIDPVSGRRLTGSAGADLDLGPAPGASAAGAFTLVLEGDGSSLIVTEGPYVRRLVPNGASIAISDDSALDKRSAERSAPRVASNGSQFFVTWLESNHLHGTRIDAVSGAYLDDPPLDIGLVYGSGLPFDVASDGVDYFAIWNDPDSNIQRRAISAVSGALGPEVSPPIDPGGLHDFPRLAWNGKYFLVVWTSYTTDPDRILGTRMTRDGAVVDSPPANFGSAVPGPPVVIADTTPPEAQRTFYVGWQASTGASLRLFRSELGVLIQPLRSLPTPGVPLLATSGAAPLFFGADSTSGVYAAPVDPASGALSTPVALSDITGGAAEVVFDGKSYVVVVVNQTIGVKRYNSVLAPLDRALPLGAPLFQLTTSIPSVLATNGKGRSLFAATINDPQRFGTTVVGRFIDNDGEPTPLPGNGGAADAGASRDGSPNDAAPRGGAAGASTSSGGTSSGGTSSGGTSSGGASSDGGSSGGTTGDGGRSSRQDAGAAKDAGVESAGGAPSGGRGGTGAGGTSSIGGASSGGRGQGATAAASGGNPGVGGATGSGAREDAGADDATESTSAGGSGCDCRVQGGTKRPVSWSFMLLGLLMARRVRRAKPLPPQQRPG